MGCGRDQTIGSPMQGGAVGRELFLSRSPEEQQAIQAEMKVISRPVCVRQNQSACSRFDQYVDAWQRLAKASPFVGYKLLAQNRFEWPDSFSRRAVGRSKPEISEELWQRTLAFQWVFQNIPEAKRLSFLEEVVTDPQAKHSLVFINLADYLLPEHTPAWTDSLDSVRNNLLAGGSKVVDESLGWTIRHELSNLRLLLVLSRPDSPQVSK